MIAPSKLDLRRELAEFRVSIGRLREEKRQGRVEGQGEPEDEGKGWEEEEIRRRGGEGVFSEQKKQIVGSANNAVREVGGSSLLLILLLLVQILDERLPLSHCRPVREPRGHRARQLKVADLLLGLGIVALAARPSEAHRRLRPLDAAARRIQSCARAKIHLLVERISSKLTFDLVCAFPSTS